MQSASFFGCLQFDATASHGLAFVDYHRVDSDSTFNWS